MTQIKLSEHQSLELKKYLEKFDDNGVTLVEIEQISNDNILLHVDGQIEHIVIPKMTRTEYQGSRYVYVDEYNHIYIFKWNGSEYQKYYTHHYVTGRNGERLYPSSITNSIPEANFKISEKDRCEH